MYKEKGLRDGGTQWVLDVGSMGGWTDEWPEL